METRLVKLINRWMPEDKVRVQSWSRIERTRAMTYVALNMIAILACIAFTLLSIALTLLGFRDFSLTIITGSLCGFLAVSVLVYFIKTARLVASTTIFFTCFLLASLTSVIISGGSTSAMLPLLISTPILASVTSGRGEGLYYTGITLMFIYVLFFLDSMGFTFLQIMPEENRNIQTVATWTFALSFNTICLFVYQYSHEVDKASH